jgi:hypothetical protein
MENDYGYGSGVGMNGIPSPSVNTVNVNGNENQSNREKERYNELKCVALECGMSEVEWGVLMERVCNPGLGLERT